MKTILILLASIGLASAQITHINVGTNADVGIAQLTVDGVFTNQPYHLTSTATNGSGETIGRQTWINLNNNFDLILSLANVANSNATAAVTSDRLPGNLVYSTSQNQLFYTNPITWNGSNYLGKFTNIYSLTTYGQNGGTNQPLTNWMSVDSGSTWQAYSFTNPYISVLITNTFTNYIGTNYLVSTNIGTNFVYTGVEIAVTGDLISTGYATIYGLSDPTLTGRTVSFAGQTVDFTGATVAGMFATNSTLYPSNTWNLTTITNAMPNFSFWLGSSNGQALTSIYLSNGVTFIKQIAP